MQKASNSDRRKSRRVPKNQQTTISVWMSGEKTKPQKVVVADLSAAGIGLVASEAIPLNTHFVLSSTLDQLLYRVVQCSRSQGRYRIGAGLVLRLGKDATPSHILQMQKLFALAS